MDNFIHIGKVSSRGQIAVPKDIQQAMDLNEGNKVVFTFNRDTLMIRKVSSKTWDELSAPLERAEKKMTPSEITDFIHEIRSKRKK